MPWIGEVIAGRYELGSAVDSHGFAIIYEAHDRMRDRQVRMKWLPLMGEHIRPLLTHEARLMTQLAGRTSGTLAYHDLVEHAGALFLVTEHVRGTRLHEWQEQGPSPQMISSMYAHLAQVLHEIHAAGVVHRDVKPGYVLILDDDDPARHGPGSPARLKLVSLELAMLTTEPDTIHGADTIIGTLPYMSPEMLHGQGATSASDVFALGCMLVEALTGKGPWRMAEVNEFFRRRLSVPPDLHDLAASPLGDLVSSMLAQSPDARPSAAEVARQLAAFANA